MQPRKLQSSDWRDLVKPIVDFRSFVCPFYFKDNRLDFYSIDFKIFLEVVSYISISLEMDAHVVRIKYLKHTFL